MSFFTKEEFACKCGCGFDTVSEELLTVLNDIRSHYKTPVKINSGCRCPAHNKAEGGALNSPHMEGIAADIVVVGISPKEVYDYFDNLYPNKYGIGLYKNRVHIDVRKTKARWTK